MDATSLAITFSNPSTVTSTVDLLTLVQKDWDSYTGEVTKMQAVRWMQEILYGADVDVDIDCGLTDGNVVTTVYAYPAYPDLSYQFKASWGTVSERIVDEFEHTEIINFTLTDTESTEYPATDIVKISLPLADNFFDSSGAVVDLSIDDVTVADGEIQIPFEAWGAVRVTYHVTRHVYTLTILPREDSTTDLFGAVVYGLYSGGFTCLEIEAPPNADELSLGDIECGYGGGSDIIYPDTIYPDDATADRKTVIGLCTGITQSDVIYDT